MSGTEKAFGLLKTWMLVNERFDALDGKLKDLGSDVAALARSHADLAQRVARIEGMIEGAAMAGSARQRSKLPPK